MRRRCQVGRSMEETPARGESPCKGSGVGPDLYTYAQFRGTGFDFDSLPGRNMGSKWHTFEREGEWNRRN